MYWLLAVAYAIAIVILVAVPVESPYPIDPQIKSTLEANRVTFIDTRNVEGLSPDSYVDGMHMNSDGATRYTHFLAQRLAEYLTRKS